MSFISISPLEYQFQPSFNGGKPFGGVGGLLVQAVVGMFVHGSKAVVAEGIDTEFKRNTVDGQGAGVEQAVHNGYGIVGGGVPQESRGRAVRYMAVAGEFFDVLRCDGVMAGEVDETAHVGVGRVGGDDGVAQDGCLDRMAVGEYFPDFRTVIAGRVVGRQMTAGREADDGDPVCVAVPGTCVAVDQFHGGGNFPNLGGEPIRRYGIGQNKDIVTLREEVEADGFCLPLADHSVTAAGADQQTGTLLVLTAHFRHIVGKEDFQGGVAAVFTQEGECVF